MHASIDYRREIGVGVHEIVVRTEITNVGGSSVRFAQTVRGPDGGVAAEAEAVLVAWDPETRGARGITADERRALDG